jgi:hypothetical protein
MIVFISTSVASSLNHTQNIVAILHTPQSTVAHALGFPVFTSRLPVTDLSTETGTSNHYEVLLPFLVQSPWNLGTQLKLSLAASRLMLYSQCTDNAENSSTVVQHSPHRKHKSGDS